MISAVRKSVFRMGFRTPAIVTAHAHLLQVDIHPTVVIVVDGTAMDIPATVEIDPGTVEG